jgi:hypothetical protein
MDDMKKLENIKETQSPNDPFPIPLHVQASQA